MCAKCGSHYNMILDEIANAASQGISILDPNEREQLASSLAWLVDEAEHKPELS